MAQKKDPVYLQTPVHRQTRSGRSFATWDGPHVMVQDDEFHFEVRLQDAVEFERARYCGEACSYDSDTLTPLSSPDRSPIIFAQPAAELESESIPSLHLNQLPPPHKDFNQPSGYNADTLASLSSPGGSPPTLAQRTVKQNSENVPALNLNHHDNDRTDDTATLVPGCAATHSTSFSVEDEPEISTQERRRKRERKISHFKRQVKRAKEKSETYGGGHKVQPSAQAKYMQPALPIEVDISMDKARVASTGYVGLDDGERSKKVYSKEELLRQGFKVIEWDGITPTPIVANNQFIGLLAGRPTPDSSWDDMMAEAADGLERARQNCHVPPKEKENRRGSFKVLRSGVSHGGGRRRPGNLANHPINKELLEELSVTQAFPRLAGFASSVMLHWAPALYQYYAEKLGALFEHYPSLKRNFSTSIFTANTYNLGPQTVCYKHTDIANLPFGLCAITALGNFNPKTGGQLVLWECKLIIEFPPGSTILILSAIVAHLNLPVGLGETRYSFTQFSSGSLFRWVDHGFQKSPKFWTSLSPETRKEEEEKETNRWAFGLSLLPIFQTSANVDLSSA